MSEEQRKRDDKTTVRREDHNLNYFQRLLVTVSDRKVYGAHQYNVPVAIAILKQMWADSNTDQFWFDSYYYNNITLFTRPFPLLIEFSHIYFIKSNK